VKHKVWRAYFGFMFGGRFNWFFVINLPMSIGTPTNLIQSFHLKQHYLGQAENEP